MPERKTIAPRLPHVAIRIIRENADAQTFIRVSKLRDLVAALAKEDGWNPRKDDLKLLYRRTLNVLPMLPDIDPKVQIREAWTLRNTKYYKIYYDA